MFSRKLKTENKKTKAMKIDEPNRTSRLRVWLASVFLLLVIRAQALDMIDRDGTLYANVSDSSHFDSTYTAANLFDTNMTGVPVTGPSCILPGDGEYA